VNKWLGENDFEVQGFFYNPNIFPQEEYERRYLAMEFYALKTGLKVHYEPNHIRTKADDCENCYRVRLKRTAQFAKEEGFDCFSTTLLISPYQKHDLLKQVGEEVAQN
jgi:predicted adenine nucleotide alpha hydrolase (AANH) superfamily ATPase